MSTLITAKIDVKKIKKELLFVGAKCTYLDLTIWINDKPDNYDNDVSIEQRTDKGQPKIFIGNGKVYKKKESSEATDSGSMEGKWQKLGKVETKPMSDINELNGVSAPRDETFDSDMPF